jgi:hypothetical protein
LNNSSNLGNRRNNEAAAIMSLQSEQGATTSVGNSSSIVTPIHPHRKNSQSRTLHRNLDSDLRNINEKYDGQQPLMNEHSRQHHGFINNNYASFTHAGPNATVAGGELQGIGVLAADLAQSQEAEKLVRGHSLNNNQSHHNSHPAAHRKIESSFNANSYINNSSVAKTSMQKRRNISFGGQSNWT